MSIHLQRDLEALEQNLLGQSSLVEQMVFRSVQSLRELRVEIAQEVIASEETVNYREVEIEEECLKILALHQPVAVDLRRVATVLKINSDLERIADLAVNISERTHSLVLHPNFQMPAHLDEMVEAAMAMLRESLDAFVRLDVTAAREVCLRDDVVDELNRQLIADLYDLVQANPADIEAAFHFYSASRHVERIADHATNISEDVIYLVDGEIARHRHDDVVL
jgi:phosphate transport system protein